MQSTKVDQYTYFEVTLKNTRNVPVTDVRIGYTTCGSNPTVQFPTDSKSRASAASGVERLLLGSGEDEWAYDIDTQCVYHDATRKAKERKPLTAVSTVDTAKSQSSAVDPVVSAEESASAFEEDLCLFDLFGEDAPEGEGSTAGASLTVTPVAGQSGRESAVLAASPEGEDDGGLFEGFGSLFEDEPVAEEGTVDTVTDDNSHSFPPDLVRMLSDRGVLSDDDDESFKAVSELFGIAADTGEGGAEKKAHRDTEIRKALLRHFAGMGASTASGANKDKSSVIVAKKVDAKVVPVVPDKHALARWAGGDHLRMATTSPTDNENSVFVPHTLPLVDGSIVGCLLDAAQGLLHYFLGGTHLGAVELVSSIRVCLFVRAGKSCVRCFVSLVSICHFYSQR
jgi:hypothetical protein